MTDSLTQVLERAAGAVPPPPDVSQLVGAGRRRRRRTMAAVVSAAGAGLAVVVGGVASVWPSLPPAQDAAILDQPTVPFEPWQNQPIDATIFLCAADRCPAITGEQLADLRARLQAEPVVQAVYYESQEDAYQRLVATLAERAPEAAESVSPDDLPAAFRIKLIDPARFSVIEQRFSAFPGVEEIHDPHRVVPVTEPMPDAETVALEIFMVEVTPDGQSLDLYRRACGRAFLVEFEETPTEVRARFVRVAGEELPGCVGSHRVELDEPLNGRPIIDLSTGDPVENLRELSGSAS